MTETVHSSDGTTITFHQTGTGPALIIVGGALSDRTVAAPLAALLAPRFSVFTYDRRGKGDSGDTPPYAVARELEDLAALIAAAGGSACVFGHSSGAVLTLEAAAGGLPIPRVAVYEPPFIIDDSRARLPADFLDRINRLLAAGQRGEALVLFMTEAVQVPAEAVAGMRHSPAWPNMERVAHTLAYDIPIAAAYQTGDPATIQRFASVTQPVLAMDGGASPDWMRHAVKLLAETLPNAQYRTLPGQTHGAAPGVIAPVIAEFLEG